MQPDLYVQFAGAFAGFVLKVAAAYLLCLLLARLLSRPGQRFAVWLAFLLGSVAYWLSLGTFVLQGSANSGIASYVVAQQNTFLARQFFLPAGFQYTAMIVGLLLASIYVAGVLILMALAIWKRIKLRSFLRQADEPSSDLQNMFDEMCLSFGIRRCELLVLSGISSPATVYWWRPRILLPRNCEQLGAGPVMADILCHELAHVARRDYLWASLSDLICGVLFFHPAVWQARKQMRIQREMACDLVVVAARPEHRADYASTLTSIARLCLPGRYPVIGIDFAASASLLTSRVSAILNQPQEASWPERISRSVVSLALVGIFGFLCLTFAVTIVFANAGKSLQTAVQMQSGPKVAQSARVPRPRRESASPREGSVITESPAYRWQASSGSSAYVSGRSGGPQSDTLTEASSGSGTGWKQPRPATPSTDATLRSIAIAVGTVGGADKDDRESKGRSK